MNNGAQVTSNPHAFAPLLWFGLEVTDEPAFEALGLALSGAPNVDVMEPSSAGLEALLDALDGRSSYRLGPAAQGDADKSGGPASTRAMLPAAIGLEAFAPTIGQTENMDGSPMAIGSAPERSAAERGD